MKIKKLVVLLTLACGLLMFGCSQPAEKSADKPADKPAEKKVTFVTIGTGGVTGVYYPTGGAISRFVNKKKEYGIKATVESTGGSEYNINTVLSGDLEFGVAQSDLQYLAYKGEGKWQDKGAQTKLRSVFSIYPEVVTLIASEDSGITSIATMKGKRVNLGNTGSGQLENSKDIMAAFGMTEADISAEYVKAVESASLLNDEKLDAYFYTVGHPNGSVKEATSGRVKVRIVDIAGAEVDALIAKYPYYAKATIAVDNYPNSINKEDIKSIGVQATLVTSADVPEDVVYAITKEVFDNFDEFKKLHPSYAAITKESMLQGLSAPMHAGALKYYKEAGLVQFINKDLIAE